jgi:protein-tyrosine phosphatase
MIDFHSHILPGVDDGSKDIPMSLEMLKLAEEEGTTYICATPHYINREICIDRKSYETKFEELKKAVEAENIKVTLVPGQEVYMDPSIPKLYCEGKIWGLNYGTYMLIELPMQQFPIYTEAVFYELRLLGITPIIAHPERNLVIMRDYKRLQGIVEQGALAQVNAGSLRGAYGRDIKEFAEELAVMNLIHLVGSDAHDDKRRTAKIRAGFEAIEEINPELYRWILQNQHNIVEGKAVEVLPLKTLKKKLNFFGLFK